MNIFSLPLRPSFLIALLIGGISGGVLGCSEDAPPTATVGYLSTSISTPSDSAARAWVEENPQLTLRRVSADALQEGPVDIDVLWVHSPDSSAYARWSDSVLPTEALARYYDQGGRLFFTNYAAHLPHEMGIEATPPTVRTLDVTNNEHNDKKGYQTFRGHPVMSRGLLGGDQVWDAKRDHLLPRVGYFGDALPKDGMVLGVERARTGVRPAAKTLIEHRSEDGGHALSAGALIYPNRPNHLRVKLHRFLENSLLYLAGTLESETNATYWRYHENVVEEFEVRSRASVSPAAGRTLADRPATELVRRRDEPTNEFFDVAGRRAIILGEENGGLREVWTHPFKLMFNYETGIVRGDSVAWLNELPVDVAVRPESFTRTYELGNGNTLTQIVYPSMSASGGLSHYRASTDGSVRLMVRFRSDLNYMWPYPKSTVGNLYYGYDDGLNALRVRDVSSDMYGVMGGDIVADVHLSGGYGTIRWTADGLQGTPTEKKQVYHASVFTLDSQNDHTLNYGFAGSNMGRDAVVSDYRKLVTQPSETYDSTVAHYRTVLDEYVTVDTPNDAFDQYFEWALIGSDRFVIETPHLGQGIMAGYGFSNPSGGAWASGTPGYAWYFGRDAEWTGFAFDSYGDTDAVRHQLTMLQENQDLQGKIYHALNTAGPGVKQFNAADSTPLYVILAGHYYRASGNTAFMRKSWPHLKAAMDFLYSTDTDGDGLIENTNVGHGWIELGELNEAHSTLYLSGIWARTLEQAAYITDHLGRDSLSQRYRRDARSVRETLNTDFWNADAEYFYQAKNRNGSFNDARTMMPAVAMHFGQLDPSKTGAALDAFASNQFSTDWGTRIIDRNSPLFDPDSYHLGTVWPLFTGWTALAEYEYGRGRAGFRHITNNMYVKDHWALGYVEEVLNGRTYTPDGFSPHQAWSETNILHPAITGLIGWNPNAPDGSARLAPQPPVHWDSLTARNLTVGDTKVRMTMTRTDTTTRYRLVRQEGPGVDVQLVPSFPTGTHLHSATRNDREVELDRDRERGRLASPVTVSLQDDATVTFHHKGGVGMVPVTPDPAPGDQSDGYRVVSTSLDGSAYTVSLEGRAGTSHTFRLRTFGPSVRSVAGAQVGSGNASNTTLLRVTFGPSDDRYVEKTVTVQLSSLPSDQ
jgi:glycogen debranching enzyme